MAINLASNYAPLLDEIYKKASVTEILASSPDVVRAGENAHTIYYPQLTVSGLKAYSRTNGYGAGSVDVEWKSATYAYDRGIKLSIDAMDDEETFEIAFGQSAQALMRTQVAPEADAYTFAQMAGKTGIINNASAGEALTTGALAIEAISKVMSAMDEAEVPEEGRVLFVTPTIYNLIIGLDTTKSREILDALTIVKVPQARFYTAITLSANGGFVKSSGAKDLNFMIVSPDALIKHDKHVVSNVINPENNPDADAYIVKYRKYAIVDVYENKVKGIGMSHSAS